MSPLLGAAMPCSLAIEPCSINLFDLCSREPPCRQKPNINKCRLSAPCFLHPIPTRRHICPPSHVLCDFNWRLLWGTRRLTVSDQSRFGPKRSKPGPWVRLKGARSGWDRELELELKSTAAHSGKIYLLKVVLIEGFKVGLKNKDYIMLSAKNWI